MRTVPLCLLLWSAGAFAQTGAVGGRLVIFEGDQALTIAQAEAEIGGDKISLELRRDHEVYEAKLERDGYFVLEGPPGKYRLEYLRLGDRAEFLAPLELSIEPGAFTCAGSISVDTGTVSNLGVNVESRREVSDDCDRLWPRLKKLHPVKNQRVAAARSGKLVENEPGLELLDRAGRMNVEAAFGAASAVRLTYEHLLTYDPRSPFDLVAFGGGGWVYGVSSVTGLIPGWDVFGGAGVEVYGVLVGGVVGLRALPPGAVLSGGLLVGGVAKLPVGPFGLGVRLEALPTPTVGIFLDVSPVALAGVLL